MKRQWSAAETSTHQDHVIAHVIGATVLGFFVLDETVHIVLDMGFIWSVYLDGQMVLLPQTAALAELKIDAEGRRQLGREIELLDQDGSGAPGLERISPAPVDCSIGEVTFLASDDRRRLILHGEASSLLIETSIGTGEIDVSAAAN